jgi:hypothetical protein
MVLVSAKPVEPKLTLTGCVEEVRIDTRDRYGRPMEIEAE